MNARQAALRALNRSRRGGAWSGAVIDSLTSGMPERDAALARRMFLTVLQNTALIDFYISAFSDRKPEKLEPQVLDILRLGVCQLVFMDRIPPHAAVSETVELCNAGCFQRAASLVNAVLRRVSENRAKLPEPAGAGSPEYLAVRHSHPLWLVRELCAEEGYAFTESFLKLDNIPAPLNVQVNTLRTTAQELGEALSREEVRYSAHPWLPDCLSIDGGVAGLAAHESGLMYVQDPAARLAVSAAGLKPGDSVLDACAAPGGKSFAAAIAMQNRGRILACDIHDKKLRLITDGAARLGIDIIETACADARERREQLSGAFDAVIADVPCSGLGVIRKKPEIRFKAESELEGLPTIQLDILRALADCVASGGVLLYSTCTVRRRENGDVVTAFLAERPDFAPEPFALPEPVGLADSGMLQLWPHINGTDGFFICKLRRKGV